MRQQRLRAKWVTYQEVPLWCCDFGGFGTDRPALQAEIAASQAMIDQHPSASISIPAEPCGH